MAAGDGLVSMTPTSIAYSGTSAGINADGGVDFSAVTSLSLNGVFTSDYDNYLVVLDNDGASLDAFYTRLRASGTDASAGNYTYQRLSAGSTSVSGARSSSQTNWRMGNLDSSQYGDTWHLYGPYLAQPTAYRVVNASPYSGATLNDFAGTHSLSTSYDGITLYSATAFTGTVHVFGYEE